MRPGNSGGPLVDREGRVLTTVFASTTGGGPAGGYGVANATVAEILAHGGGPHGRHGGMHLRVIAKGAIGLRAGSKLSCAR